MADAAAAPAAVSAPAAAPVAPGGEPAAAAAPRSLDNLIDQLRTTLTAQQHALEEARAAFTVEKTALDAEKKKLEAAMDKVSAGDIVELNVGGRLLTTTRRTLCLVPDSLLSSMFSGRWCDGASRDESGRRFLDLDPDLFEPLLSWLRFCSIAAPSHGAVVPEPAVPAGKTEGMLALLDFLCLQRYIPITYNETFSTTLHSRPGISIDGDTATRSDAHNGGDGEGGSSSGIARGAASRAAAVAAFVSGSSGISRRPQALLIAASMHGHFDTRSTLALEIVDFGESGVGGVASFNPPRVGAQFIGFMRRATLEVMPLGSPDCKPTWSPGCFGWSTGKGHGYAIVDGVKSRHPCSDDMLWIEGDHLEITIDCRHNRHHCLIELHNIVTGQRLRMETVPRAVAAAAAATARRSRSAATAAAAGAAAGGGGAPAGNDAAAGAAAAAQAAGAAAAGGAAAAAAAGPGVGEGVGGGSGAAAAAAGGGVDAPHDAGPPTAMDEWVFVVGLSRPGDKIRINRTRRQGMRPQV